MLGNWAAHKLADDSGFSYWAKRGLGGVLNHASKPLAKMWDGIAGTTDAISAGVGGAGRALNGIGHSAWSGAKDLTSTALGDVSSAGKAAQEKGQRSSAPRLGCSLLGVGPRDLSQLSLGKRSGQLGQYTLRLLHPASPRSNNFTTTAAVEFS